MDGLEQATEQSGTSGRGQACDCFDRRVTGVRHGRDDGGGFEVFEQLARTVEGDIIPRLLLSHQVNPHRLRSRSVSVPAKNADLVGTFAEIVLKENVEAAEAYLAALAEAGYSRDALLLDVIGPAAGRLGGLWLSDECSFFDVTMGLCRLHQVLRDFGYGGGLASGLRFGGPRCLLAPAPGEQHSFGILMVDEFFRRAGWNSVALESGDPDRVLRLVREESHVLVGLSMSCDHFADTLTDLIREVRRVSCNSDVKIMVGGPWFNADPGRASLVGADLSAVDGRQAIVQTRELLRLSDARL